ncbi:hypothetical protein [Streptomyces sp. CAS3]
MTAPQRRLSGLNIAAVRTRKHATALLLAGSLLALAGCSDSHSDTSTKPRPAPTDVSPSPSGTVDAAVIAAYNSSWAAQPEAYRKASSAGTGLKKSTTLRALLDIENDLEAMRKAGQVTTVSR